MAFPIPAEAEAPAARSRFAGQRVHFIGIGGCGMSGLAGMLLDAGAIVTGSEPRPNPTTFALDKRGVTVSRDQMGELLSGEVDLVVRTAAIPDANAEYLAARHLNLPTLKYAQLLGQVMAERLGVAVAGTHGKSTTTAMTSYALLECGLDPSFVVGGTVPQLGGGGSRSGGGPAFVVEACEYDRSFHHLRPRVALLLNVEEDHLDCYTGGIDEIVESFAQFIDRLPADGLVIANGQDARVAEVIARSRPNPGTARAVQTVGLSNDPAAFTWSTRPVGVENGGWVGEAFRDGRPVGTFRLSVAGEHNLYNATMALAAAAACGADPAAALAALSRFTGVDRRLSEIGRCNGAVIVDDYGHHPTEIRATLQAVREKYQPARLLCVFQPHQHSRTRFLLEDFAQSFALADETIVPDIYFVRDSEEEKGRVSATQLVERIASHGRRAVHLPRFPAIIEYLRGVARAGDVILTMGAGNVFEIGEELAG